MQLHQQPLNKRRANPFRSTLGSTRVFPLTAKKWRIIGASVLVLGAFLIILPLFLQLLFGLGRLLLLITMIVVISATFAVTVRQLPRFKKSIATQDKAPKQIETSHDHQQ
jgi:hypothetical protein